MAAVNKGVVFHKIFELIRYKTDVERAVKTVINKGLLPAADFATTVANITALISTPQVSHWFDGSYVVNNEIEISDAHGSTKRPDRVMEADNEMVIVDYKFGMQNRNEYTQQVNEYAALVGTLTNKPVKAFLWFVSGKYLINTLDNTTIQL